MKKSALIILFSLLCNLSQAQQNYIEYHKLINKAETEFFLNDSPKKAFELYDSAFKQFDFVFVRDCYVAAVLAWQNKNINGFHRYTTKGFEYGLPLAMAVKIIAPTAKDSAAQQQEIKQLVAAFTPLRKKYLASINYELLEKAYDIYGYDQFEKNKWVHKSYEQLWPSIINQIVAFIHNNGFPGERLIGIEERRLFRNLKAFNYWKKNFNTQHIADSSSLCNELFFPPLVHIPCSYGMLKETLEVEMKKGNIHPRDIAMLYDNTIRFRPNTSKIMRCDLNLPGYYGTNVFAEYPKKHNYELINEMRAKLYIVPLQVDEAKKEYCAAHNCEFSRFGFFLCR